MKALFLDRDGVINEDLGYVYRKEDFIFKKGILSLTRKALHNDFSIFIVTNQAGIARGYYTEDDFLQTSKWLKEYFQEKGVVITDIYYCPHHPKYGSEIYKRKCNCRKPKPQMFLDAQTDYEINMDQSIMIGDKPSDLIAAESAGVKGLYLIGNLNEEDLRYDSYKRLSDIERIIFD